MNSIFSSPRKVLTVALLSLGLIIAAVPKNTTTPFKLSAEQILSEIKGSTQFVEPDLIAQMIVEKDPSLRLIDVRSKDEFDKFSLPGAINIPIDNLLSAEYVDILHQSTMMNVFYANGSTRANEAWIIARQLGYSNNYVLSGGLNYWFENILNPQKPSANSADDELAKYDFRKGVSQALGGGSQLTTTTKTPINEVQAGAPKPKADGKKVKIKGGCA